MTYVNDWLLGVGDRSLFMPTHLQNERGRGRKTSNDSRSTLYTASGLPYRLSQPSNGMASPASGWITGVSVSHRTSFRSELSYVISGTTA